MARAKIGDRVIAICGSKNGVVESFGEGVYAGDFPLPKEAGGFNFGQDNPRIDLDNGKVVWGCESWWGPVEAVKKRCEGLVWKEVDIDAVRAASKSPALGDGEMGIGNKGS